MAVCVVVEEVAAAVDSALAAARQVAALQTALAPGQAPIAMPVVVTVAVMAVDMVRVVCAGLALARAWLPTESCRLWLCEVRIVAGIITEPEMIIIEQAMTEK